VQAAGERAGTHPPTDPPTTPARSPNTPCRCAVILRAALSSPRSKAFVTCLLDYISPHLLQRSAQPLMLFPHVNLKTIAKAKLLCLMMRCEHALYLSKCGPGNENKRRAEGIERRQLIFLGLKYIQIRDLQLEKLVGGAATDIGKDRWMAAGMFGRFATPEHARRASCITTPKFLIAPDYYAIARTFDAEWPYQINCRI
jgi:hypothetical protein